jgi:hypothetical protein
MFPDPDRLTLASLLADPLTQLVMKSDNISPTDVTRAFAAAQAGLETTPRSQRPWPDTCCLALTCRESPLWIG